MNQKDDNQFHLHQHIIKNNNTDNKLTNKSSDKETSDHKVSNKKGNDNNINNEITPPKPQKRWYKIGEVIKR